MDKNYAYIRITGKDDISAVTTALGILPTTFWNIGDKRRNGSMYKHAHWEINLPEFQKELLDEAILEVVNYIEKNNLDFAKVPKNFTPVIQCVGFHENKSPGFHLSKELIKKIGNIGLAIDFDLYCHAN